ncbi:DUF3800 domain-containing protein [Rhodanobacter umsongensis]
MSETFNLYCDESCHLPNDGKPLMVLGVVSCPLGKVREIAVRLREIKRDHGMPDRFEVKWNKVSKGQVGFYRDWLDYFFDDDDLSFRAVVADKTGLQHEAFGQDHDDWYYKMMFLLVQNVIRPDACFRLYLDKKDTRSARKVEKLHDVLCNSLLDFNRKVVERVQVIESHAVEQMQLADLLMGAVGYINRGLAGNAGKEALIDRIKERTGYTLTRSTLLREPKFNLFLWHGRTNGLGA